MIKRILVLVSLIAALPAMAAIDTWNFATDNRNLTSGVGNTFTVDNDTGSSDSSDVINITGWSDTGTSNDIEAGRLGYTTSYGLTLTENGSPSGSPNHAIDNFDNNFDMVLVTFDQLINLSEFGIDWRYEGSGYSGGYSQADISVVAYTGSGDISTLAGVNKWDAIAAPGSGWTTVGHYANVDSGNDIAYQTVTTAVESKYWLIGAYNPVFTGGERTPGGLGTGWKDAFKLASVAGTYADTPPPGGQIPEPASLFLFATALFGLMSTKRSKANI